MEVWNNFVDWLKSDSPLGGLAWWVICAIALAAVILLVVIIVVACVGAKKRKKARAAAQEPAPAAEEKPEEQPEPVAEEKPEEEPAPVAEEKPEEEPAPVAEEKPEEQPEPVAEEKPEEKPAEEAAATAEPVKEPAKQPAKKPAPKPAAKKATPTPAPAKKPAAKGVKGKWEVHRKGEKEFVAYLLASNGQVLLTSEVYTSVEGARGGIETIRKNVQNGNFEFYRAKQDYYYFKLKSAANRLLSVSAAYATEVAVQNAVESVKRFAIESDIVEDVVEDITYTAYQPTAQYKETGTVSGKWRIVEEDGRFYAKLFANNGQMLLSSESVSSAVSAQNSIDNIKKCVKEGRFIIDRDKKGKFVFKIRNAQKSTICIGETYGTIGECQQAVESVVKFCGSAKLEE